MNRLQLRYFRNVLTVGVIVALLYAAFYWAIPAVKCFHLQGAFIVWAFIYGLWYFSTKE